MGISIWQLLIVMALIPLAFLPTIIAVAKNHPHKVAIILVNIFGGLLYGIGWLIALVWCFITPGQIHKTSINVSEELERFHSLKEKGVITQEEFDTRKQVLLETK
jgi:hypothetical protein